VKSRDTAPGTRLDSIDGGLAPPPERWEADLGRPSTPQERRVRLVLLTIALALVVLAYVSRAVVTTTSTTHLPVRNLDWVVSGKLIRSSQPQDIDFANLRDQLSVRGIVNLRTTESLEPNVVKSFGMAYLHVSIAPNMVPTRRQLARIVAFLRRETSSHHAVLVHDENGRDPVTIVTAMLAVLHGVSSESAVEHAGVDRSRPRWTNDQVQAFDSLARALGEPVYLPPTFHQTKQIVSRYSDVGGLEW
jgi:hypothetical protein